MHTAELVQVMSGIPEACDSNPVPAAPSFIKPPLTSRVAKKEEAEVVIIDDDGDDLIDLVDINTSQDAVNRMNAPDRRGDRLGDVDKPDLQTLTLVLQSALEAVKDELAAVPIMAQTVSCLEQADQRRADAAARKKKALNKEQQVLRDEIAQQKSELRNERADLQHRREEVRQKEGEVNEELSTAKKLRLNLDITKKEMEVRETELEVERAKVSEEQLQCLREKRRYEALVKARQSKDLKERRGSFEGSRKNEPACQGRQKIRRVVSENGSDSDVSSSDELTRGDDFKIRSESSTQSEGNISRLEKPLDVFGSQLQKPSRLNRPAAPRRGGARLSAFAPRRSKVQRPLGGIGRRPGARR